MSQVLYHQDTSQPQFQILMSTQVLSYMGQIGRGETLQVLQGQQQQQVDHSDELNGSFAEAFLLPSQFLRTKPPLKQFSATCDLLVCPVCLETKLCKGSVSPSGRATQITALAVYRRPLPPSLQTLSLLDTMALFSLITKTMCCVDIFIIFNEIICLTFDLMLSPVSNRVQNNWTEMATVICNT